MTNNQIYRVNVLIAEMTGDKPYELANSFRKACEVCYACPFKASGECLKGKFFEVCYVSELKDEARALDYMAERDE